MNYDCIIIGGGIAGLQASIQLGRYNRNVLIIDSEDGRSSLCRKYNNILGFPEGVSGKVLRQAGRQQAGRLGVVFVDDEVIRLHKSNEGFLVDSAGGQTFEGKNLLLSTGVKDNIPAIPGVKPCLGLSIYVCPDCDGYEITNKKTIVMGQGDVGASMALTLLYWSSDITYINHGGGEVSRELQHKLKTHNVFSESIEIEEVFQDQGTFQGIKTKDGRNLNAEKGFVAFGGNKVRSDLAIELGADTLENKHLVVDPKTKMTSVENLWAAGDTVAHSEFVTAAMGEGSLAAIWIQKELMRRKT
ncbi:NAD(P)/FAD-dependent oxidoreductase [Halobacillus seohaensis]|uniref:NAD(P)/FAD-dependent oxidoreductase n=1 Tax=Halobacillus seohaensis TaxID=447421 RepID=A0ABW2EQF4_9BACI